MLPLNRILALETPDISLFGRGAIYFGAVLLVCGFAAGLAKDLPVSPLRPAVVMIESGGNVGTGFVAGRYGDASVVVTAAHVVETRGVATVVDPNHPSRELSATVVRSGGDADDRDIAILSVRGLESLEPVVIGATARAGESVAVWGFPVNALDAFHATGELAPDLHEGHVASVDPQTGALAHTIVTDHGDSGAPVFDRETGTVIGAVRGYYSNARGARTYIAVGSRVIAAFLREAGVHTLTVTASIATPQPGAAEYAMGRRYDAGDGVERDYAEAASLYRQALRAGNVAARAALANLLLEGLGVPPDRAKAIELMRAGAAAGDPVAFIEMGDALANSDPSRARLAYEAAARAGLPEAQRRLCETRLDSDPAAAYQFCSAAAIAGDAEAAYEAGLLAREGRGTAPDATSAERWFAEAASEGDDRGAFEYARMLAATAPKHDPAVAFWYAKAAEPTLRRAQNGDGEAMERVASLYRHQLVPAWSAGSLDDQEAEAKVWYERALQVGRGCAGFHLAVWESWPLDAYLTDALYYHRDGESIMEPGLTIYPQEPVAARIALDRAAELHCADAEHLRGLEERPFAYPNDFEPPYSTDVADAQRWLERAVADGSINARRDLAQMLETSNKPRAVSLLQDGDRLGCIPCDSLLSQWYGRGIGVPRDLDRSRALLERAASGGDRSSAEALADLLMAAGDRDGARRWYAEAAKSFTSARDKLDALRASPGPTAP